jgi:hypothetical protein
MANLLDVIQHAALMNVRLYCVWGEVQEVDKDNLACRVTPFNGNGDIWCSLTPNNLSTDILIIPKINSNVYVGFIDQSSAFVIGYSEVESVTFGKSGARWAELTSETIKFYPDAEQTNGGMVIAEEITKRLNAIENNLIELQTNFNTHIHPFSIVPAPIISPTLSTVVNTTTITNASTIQNVNVEH